METKKNINFDVSRSLYDEDGIKNFYWPVSYSGRRTFAEEFLNNLSNFFSSLNEEERKDAEVLLTFQTNLFVIILTMAQASLLKKRTEGHDVFYPQVRASCWRADSPKAWLDDYSKRLLKSQYEPSWKTMARYVKYCFKSGRIKALPLSIVAKKLPVITGTSPLLEQYLEEERTKTSVYAPYSAWFYSLSELEKSEKSIQPFSQNFIDKYIACIPQIEDHKISDEYIQTLKTFMSSVSHSLKLYLYRLEKNKKIVPSLLLTGSLGMLWNSVLALAVRRSGGKVISFDHGFGCNIWSSSTTAFVETQLTDQFFTFSEFSAKAIQSNMKLQCFSNKKPEIKFYNTKQKKIILKSSGVVKSQCEKIMYVQPLFIGDQGELDPIMPNIVSVDWQIRLLGQLRSLGYDVLLKPHPLSGTQIPTEQLEKLSVKVLTQPFEDVCMDADVLIFDYALSTTFNLGILSGKPMVYFNFSDAKYPDELQSALHNRIEIVHGTYDEENRAQVDWATVQTAIENAKTKNDQEICCYVLPNFIRGT